MRTNINYIMGAMLLLNSMLSCNKYLNTVPDDFLTPTQYYQTEGELNTALTGIYDILGQAGLYQNYYWAVLSSSNDIDYWRSNLTANTNPLYYNQIASDSYVTGTWNTLYNGINRANAMLTAIDASPVDSATKVPLKAQAQFLRGYYYFLLVSNWGAVPLRLTPTTSVGDAVCARSSIADVYAQVLKDMTEAEPLLPTIAAVGSDAGIRVTNTVAEGILARVCLTMAGVPLNDVSKLSDAKYWAQKVIKSGVHSLNPDYRQIFINQCAGILEPKESMWEVSFSANTSNVSEKGNVGALNSIRFTNLDYGYCYGTYGVTKLLWDKVTAISATDLRRDWNMSPFTLGGATTGTTGVTKTYLFQTTAAIWGRYPGKWRREFETYTPKTTTTTINFPILRYADILLMYAEAENELNGPTDSAYWALNQIRERAQGAGYRITAFTVTNGGSGYTSAPTVTVSSPAQGNTLLTTATVSGGKVTAVNMSSILNGYYTGQPTITFTGGGGGTGATASATLVAIVPTSADMAKGQSQAVFRQAVRDERAVELSQEALRKHDLIRWGILETNMRALAATIRANSTVLASYQYVATPCDNVSSKDIFLPIPLTELTLNSALNRENNPGY